MPNPYFQFKQFTIHHDRCAMKVTTDACLFGAWCAKEIKNDRKEITTSLLDIGSGSGLLSLMVAQKNNGTVEAIELDEEAAQQSIDNISSSPWRDRITVRNEDVLQFNFSHLYDVILSNPPFYENELSSTNTKKNTAHHGEGLKLSELARLIKKQLAPTGIFYLLLPYKRAQEAEKILERENLFIRKKVFVSQSTSQNPFRIMLRGGHNNSVQQEERISITNEDRQYTKEFISLLSDYYLHL